MTNPKSRAAAGGTRRTEPVASRDGRAGGQPPAPPAGMGLRPSRTLPQIRQAFHATRVDSHRGAKR